MKLIQWIRNLYWSWRLHVALHRSKGDFHTILLELAPPSPDEPTGVETYTKDGSTFTITPNPK